MQDCAPQITACCCCFNAQPLPDGAEGLAVTCQSLSCRLALPPTPQDIRRFSSGGDGQAQGREVSQGELSNVMGELRCSVSVVVVKGQALCLLERRQTRGGTPPSDRRRRGGGRGRPSTWPTRSEASAGWAGPLSLDSQVIVNLRNVITSFEFV